MSQYSIRFEWYKDQKGFDLVKDQKHPPRLIRRGGALLPFKPLRIDTLYAKFAQVKNDEQLLEFVNRYGPLTKGGLLQAPSKTPKVKIARGRKIEITELYSGEDVKEDLQNAHWFRNALNNKNNASALQQFLSMRHRPLRIADTRLLADGNGLRVEFCPDTLIDAMRLQLSLALIGSEQLRFCKLCFAPFRVGVGTNKRADAQFCSDEHRVQFNSRKRAL